MVLFEFALGNPDRARVLYEAYVDADGPARIYHPGNFSMAIAQIGHIAEKDYTRWLDPGASEIEPFSVVDTRQLNLVSRTRQRHADMARVSMLHHVTESS